MILSRYLPKHVTDVPTVADVLQALDSELEKLELELDKIEKESTINTASDIGLSLLESQFGLVSNLTDLDERRERVKAKLRGTGTTTHQMIKEMALAFSCGDIDIEFTPSDYLVTIKYISQMGVPTNEEVFKNAIRDIIPAHLAVAYEYTYVTWKMIEDETWKNIETLTWSELSQWGG